jgi:hypothetical protein
MFASRQQKAEEYRNVMTDNKSLENVAKLK